MPQVTNPSVTFHPFSPWLASPEQLERTLVGRDEVLGQLLDNVAGTVVGSTTNHVLLVGPRGIGKTHLLCLLDHYVSGRLTTCPGGRQKIHGWDSVLFSEEEYAHHNSLANFLLALCKKLAQQSPSETLWRLPEDIEAQPDANVCECCMERITRYYNERQRRILILIDNFQKIIQQWDADDHDRFRGFLSGQNFCLLTGSAPSVFREVANPQAAFHQFFEVCLIEELDAEQVHELMHKWFKEESREQEFEERREELAKKVPAIQLLTGGNPRLVYFLCQIATRSTFLGIEKALKGLMEEVREYFIRRFDELPDQARKILDTLAEMSGPATPSEIAATARVNVASVNSQLGRLRRNHYVRRIKFKQQRATRYDISERLFRLWRQTATVAGRQRFQFLTDFLKLYYTPEEVLSLYREHERFLGAAEAAERSEVVRRVEELYYFQAAARGEFRHDIFSTRVQSLLNIGEMDWAEQETAHFIADAVKAGDKEGAQIAYKASVEIHLKAERYKEATKDIASLLKADADQDAYAAAQELIYKVPDSADAWEVFGHTAYMTGNYEQAVEAFRKAKELGDETAKLWALQSAALQGLGQHEEALKCAEKAAELGPENSWIWEILGNIAGQLGSYHRASEAFRKATELGGETARLWTSQSMALLSLKRYGEASKCAEKATELEPGDFQAWEAFGWAAFKIRNYVQAVEAYGKATELGGETARLCAMQSLFLQMLKRNKEALPLAERAVELEPENSLAWETLGSAALYLGDYGRALEVSHKALELDQNSPETCLLKSQALRALGRPEDALRVISEFLTRQYDDSILSEKAWNSAYLGRFDEALGCIRLARDEGLNDRRFYHDHGNILLLAGKYEEASENLKIGLQIEPDDWDLQIDQGLASFCMDPNESKVAELVSVVSSIYRSPEGASGICGYILEVAHWALSREEDKICRGLLAATLVMQEWHGQEWFGSQLGAFFRRALDLNPKIVPDLVEQLSRSVKNEAVLRLLDPFLKAVEYIRTRDVTLLEKLFPEITDLVLDIARRIDPDLKEITGRTDEM